jgi:hypothetical protein
MTPEERAEALWLGLNDCAAIDRDTAISTVAHWLEYHGAGVPDVPLLQEKIRSDALFWAELATSEELEAYVVAGLTALTASALTSRQTRRMAAMAWRRMTPQERVAFKNWIEKDE